MAEEGVKNPEMLAKQLFRGIKYSQLPSFKQVIKALEAAKGESFTLSAEDLEAARKEGQALSEQWCAFCDSPSDECTDCDASDWSCNGDDNCFACDEGDTCEGIDL